MLILGLDPGTARLGFGLVEVPPYSDKVKKDTAKVLSLSKGSAAEKAQIIKCKKPSSTSGSGFRSTT